MITQEELKSILHYDPDTGLFTYKVRISYRRNIGDVAGSVSLSKGKLTPYIRIQVMKKRYQAHRLAFLYMTGKFPLDQVDHIDLDGTNNAWSNLRECNHSQNQRNQRLVSKANKTGITGVLFRHKHGTWGASINDETGRVWLGSFKTLLDAASARKSAENKLGYTIKGDK